MKAATALTVALAFMLAACGEEEPETAPISGDQATQLCAARLKKALPGVSFTWKDPIIRVPDEFAYIVGTGTKKKLKYKLHCSIDLVNGKVVGSQHGLK